MFDLVIAAAVDPGAGINLTSLIGPILSTGLVGVILIMLIFELGFITKKSHDREIANLTTNIDARIKEQQDALAVREEDVKELKQANAQLQVLVQDKMIPALVQSTEVSRAYVTELARQNDRRRDRDDRES